MQESPNVHIGVGACAGGAGPGGSTGAGAGATNRAVEVRTAVLVVDVVGIAGGPCVAGADGTDVGERNGAGAGTGAADGGGGGVNVGPGELIDEVVVGGEVDVSGPEFGGQLSGPVKVNVVVKVSVAVACVAVMIMVRVAVGVTVSVVVTAWLEGTSRRGQEGGNLDRRSGCQK
jgi:hypothetical protein